MARASGRHTTPDQRVRDLRKQLRTLEVEPPGPERAEHLAALARAAHEERMLNMAMHAASLCLDDDPDDPERLVAVYLAAGRDPEERLHALDDLRDLARYVGRHDISAIAEQHLRQVAQAWVAAGEEPERRYRLRRVQSVASVEVADAIRTTLGLPD